MIGAKYIVFLDNGSKDETIKLLQQESDVSVFRTTKPYKLYKDIMKQWLVRSFGKSNWVLCVDIDEMFDYPFRSYLPLGELLNYLNQHKFNAVVAQLLDLFPKGAISKKASWREDHCFFSLDGIERQPYKVFYGEKNEVPDIDLQVMFGGMRLRKFDVRALLTKHPLQFPSRGVVMHHAHHVSGAKLADVSAVLLHYKYVGDFRTYHKRIAAEESFSFESREYKKYVEVLDSDRGLVLFDETAQKYHSPEKLVDDGLIVVSDRFRSMLYARQKVAPK